MFERNEVDLLEEDVDEIYRVYGQQEQPKQEKDVFELTMEQLLIQEQVDTEEESNKRFEEKTKQIFSTRFSETGSEDFIFEEPMLKDLFHQNKRPVFYEQVYRWADGLFLIAQSYYLSQVFFREPAFRVLLNVKLVPIKLSVVIQEDREEDAFSKEMAEKECRLALVYLERVLGSLSLLVLDDSILFGPYKKVGKQFERVFHELLSRMKRRRDGFAGKTF